MKAFYKKQKQKTKKTKQKKNPKNKQTTQQTNKQKPNPKPPKNQQPRQHIFKLLAANDDFVYSGEPSSIDPVLSVQPDHCYKNLAIQSTWKYCFINYHNLIHVSVS